MTKTTLFCCTARTIYGYTCTNRRKQGSPFCGVHQPGSKQSRNRFTNALSTAQVRERIRFIEARLSEYQRPSVVRQYRLELQDLRRKLAARKAAKRRTDRRAHYRAMIDGTPASDEGLLAQNKLLRQQVKGLEERLRKLLQVVESMQLANRQQAKALSCSNLALGDDRDRVLDQAATGDFGHPGRQHFYPSK
ncbi:MAG: hypothetical protein WC729_29180 [Sphingomonas sp.]|jgi:hypothetical protein|uniref:hypothetical protein n=1 Tax=Sphingomonas sp. TaxID=28214 RepID=UPI00356B4E30